MVTSRNEVEPRVESANPRAEALIMSMRAIGYELETAIADLIDNSIFANSKKIRIDYSWNLGKPWIMIYDDGDGMSLLELKSAMVPGSTSPQEIRDESDLGRFGLGLKTASWSQCRVMTVMSKIKSNQLHYRRWDIDHVCSSGKWELLLDIDKHSKDIMESKLTNLPSGTVILWQNLDRVIGNLLDDEVEYIFKDKFSNEVINHLEMVFHRYLTGKDSVEIFVGRHRCVGWDPFLTWHESTEERTHESLESKDISVTPFILPHGSKFNTEIEKTKAGGPKGWSKQQGFYIYRNERMIICGGYLDFLDMEEKDWYRLCRIKVDLPNNVDDEWNIDVRKAVATPPLRNRSALIRIANRTRELAADRYRARSRAREISSAKSPSHEIWKRKAIGEKVTYQINIDSPGILFLREKDGISKRSLKNILHVIERTLPFREITVDNNEIHDAMESEIEPPSSLVKLAIEFAKNEISKGKTPKDAIDYVTLVAFPLDGPKLRSQLELELLGG